MAVDSVQQMGKSFLVGSAEIDKFRVGCYVEGFFTESVKGAVHDQNWRLNADLDGKSRIDTDKDKNISIFMTLPLVYPEYGCSVNSLPSRPTGKELCECHVILKISLSARNDIIFFCECIYMSTNLRRDG
jgi:hypothetical protein